MTELLGCPAPAKINLFLHVTDRRADGYHLIETVFLLVDLVDRLDFHLRRDGKIERLPAASADPDSRYLDAVAEAEDLTVRAARALAAVSGTTLGASIGIDKRIPMGGGLGGGSSDAATTLLALNRLWGLGLSRRALMEIGVSLGADVPFFLFGQNAFARGIGEELIAVAIEVQHFCVIHPGVGVPTPEIFQAPELTRNTESLKITDFSASAHGRENRQAGKQKWPLGVDFGRNDLEPVAVARYPEVGEALKWLGRFGPARMSGSGACVYCPTQSREIAQNALRDLPSRWTGWALESLAEHPLADWSRD